MGSLASWRIALGVLAGQAVVDKPLNGALGLVSHARDSGTKGPDRGRRG